MQNHNVDGVREREPCTSPLERGNPFILKRSCCIQCSQVNGVGPSSPCMSQDQSFSWATLLLNHSIFFLSQPCLWQAPAKCILAIQQTQWDSKCVIKCFAESRPGSFLLDIHMLFAVAIRSRCRHCEPMFITPMLLTSPWLPPLRTEARGQQKSCPCPPFRRKFSFPW